MGHVYSSGEFRENIGPKVRWLFPLAVFFLILSGSSSAIDLAFQSETALRIFEREVRTEDRDRPKTVLPVYEYLQLDAGNLFLGSLSFHTHGWLRHDFGSSAFYSEDTDGELLYGYFQYLESSQNLMMRFGRQYVFELNLDEGLDGLLVNMDISPYFSALVFGGKPVSLDEIDGGNGDAIVGGKITHQLGSRYEIGAFYRHVANNGARHEEVAGFDLSLLLPREVSLLGRSTWNLITEGWAEHSYQAMFTILGVQLRPSFDLLEYENFLVNGNRTGPFPFLAGTKERITTFGIDLTHPVSMSVDLGTKFKHYDYDQRDGWAQYYSGLIVWRWEDFSEWGLELGYMAGDRDENRYFLGRSYVYKDFTPGFLTADFLYAHYEEQVMEENQSFFVSLALGRRLFGDNLEVELSADFSSDPYFQSDLRGMIKVRYNFNHSDLLVKPPASQMSWR